MHFLCFKHYKTNQKKSFQHFLQTSPFYQRCRTNLLYSGCQRTVMFQEMKRQIHWPKRVQPIKDQKEEKYTYKEAKTIVRNMMNEKWKEDHPRHNDLDAYYQLSRQEQVIIFRLRTGHNRLKAHLHKMLKIGNTATCDCGTEEETADHLLQDCQLYQEQRRKIWPHPATPAHSKLYGDVAQLQATVQFVQDCGFCI